MLKMIYCRGLRNCKLRKYCAPNQVTTITTKQLHFRFGNIRKIGGPVRMADHPLTAPAVRKADPVS